MKKLILLLILVVLIGCKTKEIIVDRVVYQKDSTEIVSLKKQLLDASTVIASTKELLKIQEQKVITLIEQSKLSEQEKQSLKESFETVIKKYNDKGVLIEEAYSVKTSELNRDLNRMEEKNKDLQSNITFISSQNKLLTSINARQTQENTELSKKVDLLEKEKAAYISKKISNPKYLISFIIGAFIAGIVVTLLRKPLFNLLKKLFIK